MFWIDTPRTRAVAGHLPADGFARGGLEARLGSGPALLAVQSLDAQPVEASGDILISVVVPAAPATRKDLPFLSEPVTGVVRFHAPPGLMPAVSDGVTHRVEGDLHILEFDGAVAPVLLRLR